VCSTHVAFPSIDSAATLPQLPAAEQVGLVGLPNVGKRCLPYLTYSLAHTHTHTLSHIHIRSLSLSRSLALSYALLGCVEGAQGNEEPERAGNPHTASRVGPVHQIGPCR